jgi:CheY-like chemotaxis protein
MGRISHLRYWKIQRPSGFTVANQIADTMASDILIVDDEADIRELVADILKDEGYGTRTARDSDEALFAVVARRPNLVFLDIWLQGSRLDGLQLLDSLKQQDPELPIVMISGHGNIETAVSAIKRGAYDFIEKPFKADRLTLAAERAVRSGVVDVRDQLAPSPWSVEELAACFVVWDGNGEVFATVYYEQEPGRQAATKLPTKDDARRIAVQVAKLPELLDAGGLVPTQSPPALATPLPAAWSVDDIGDAFVVRDSARQKLAYVYYEEEPGRRRAAKLLTKNEARRVATNVAKLPELLRRK